MLIILKNMKFKFKKKLKIIRFFFSLLERNILNQKYNSSFNKIIILKKIYRIFIFLILVKYKL
jgi:hypothetical protein